MTKRIYTTPQTGTANCPSGLLMVSGPDTAKKMTVSVNTSTKLTSMYL